MKLYLSLPLLLVLPGVAHAGESETDDVAQHVEALDVRETKLEVVKRTEAQKEGLLDPPEVDDPVEATAPVFTFEHRKEGWAYLDPFLGREIYPEISATLRSGFVREKFANSSETGGSDGRMTLSSRVDLNLWFLDIRVPFNSAEPVAVAPAELVLKAPFSVGRHRFAPILALHVPIYKTPGKTVVEAGIGYHYSRMNLGLKLEASAFSGTHDRLSEGQSAGMLGFNAALSYLVMNRIGIVVEADGTTAVSEKRPDVPPEIGDTVLRLLPGLRFFPKDEAFQLGIAGVFTFVPDGYSVSRQQGVLFDIGYTFL